MIKILLADDQPLLLSALETILGAQSDLTVAATAANGAEAVEKARAHRIDVAVLDIRMPVLDGIAAATQIMELGPKVIMLTTLTTTPSSAPLSTPVWMASCSKTPSLTCSPVPCAPSPVVNPYWPPA